MSSPTFPRSVPDQQQVRFGLALAKYLGIDPTRFAMLGWTVGEDDAHVDLRAHMPAEDLLHMFNTGEVPGTEEREDGNVLADGRGM